MNRYEQITSASIEELARILVKIYDNGAEIYFCRDLPECLALVDSGEDISQEKCAGCMMRWLEEEATSERMEEGEK